LLKNTEGPNKNAVLATVALLKNFLLFILIYFTIDRFLKN